MEEVAVFRLDFEGSDEILAKMAELRKEQERLKETNKTLSSEVKAGNLESAQAVEKNKIAIKEYGKELSILEKQATANIAANKQQTGSLVQMREQLSKMTKEYDNLTKEQRESDAVGVKMQENIAALRNELMGAEAATGRFQRNVGNYSEAMDTANMSLGEMKKELRELKNMSFSGLKPEEIQAVKTQISQLTEGIRDFQEEVTTASESGIPGIVAGLQGIIASAQLVTGTLSMFGIENEKLEKTMVQLIGVAQGLATVEDMIAKKKLQVMAAQAKDMAIKTALAVKTAAVTAAQWLWNAALTANPIGLIVAGIALLTGAIIGLIKYYDKIISIAKRWLGIGEEEQKVMEKTIDVHKEYQKQIEETNRLSAERQKSIKHEIDLMTAKGATVDEIKMKERELINEQIENSKKTIALQIAEANVYLKKYNVIARMAGINEEQVKAYYEQINGLKDLENELEIFDAKETKRKSDAAKATAEANKKANEERIKAEKDEAIRSEKAFLERRVIESINDEERLNNKITQIRRLAELELQNESLTESERLLIKAQAFNAEMQLRNEYHAKELEAIKAQNDAKAVVDKEEEERRKKIIEDEKKRLEDLKAYEETLTDARLDIARSFTEGLELVSKDQSRLAKAAKAIQKGIALVEIAINTQREISAIRLAAAANPLNAATAGVAGITQSSIQTIAALAKAAVASAKILALNTGGQVPGRGNKDTVPAMLTPGEGVLRANAMNSNNVHSLSGTPKQIASYLNTMYGGVSFFANGGIVGESAASRVNTLGADIQAQSLIEAMQRVNIIATIQDINNAASSEANRMQIANY